MVSRRLIVMTPVLLVAGICAQLILLALAIVLYVPLLVYPKMVDGPYRWVTRGMARIAARSMFGKRREPNPVALSFRDRRAARGASRAARLTAILR